ncbi:MAG TPA: phosphatidate cytidylyltransferase [Bacteroidales bacterium]|nr:phosphatidate cytidylyltransferase [Bacteroidales bacterium]
MKNLFQRTLSGIVYLVLIIGSLFAGRYAYGSVFMLIGILAMLELYSIFNLEKKGLVTLPGLILTALAFIIGFCVSSGLLPAEYAAIALVFGILLLITGLYVKDSDATKIILPVVTGLVYVALPFASMNYLVFPQTTGHQYTHRIILGIFTLIWINDTGAYVTGMMIGRHKMFPRISPKKTWEGLAGGTAFTLVASIWMNRLMGILEPADWIALAIITSIFGVYGDLTESLLKRNAGIKDSGNLIPGHGGILDRFDSILFVVPVAVIYLMIRGI